MATLIGDRRKWRWPLLRGFKQESMNELFVCRDKQVAMHYRDYVIEII